MKNELKVKVEKFKTELEYCLSDYKEELKEYYDYDIKQICFDDQLRMLYLQNAIKIYEEILKDYKCCFESN